MDSSGNIISQNPNNNTTPINAPGQPGYNNPNYNPNTQPQTNQTNPPPLTDTSTTQGQVDWYNKDQTAFNSWANQQDPTGALANNVAKAAQDAQNIQDENDIRDKLDQIANGTYPLTKAQQSLLDATKQQADQLIAQQQITNANYENGVRLLGNVTGRSEYFPDIAMGEVQTAINSGIQKIADLNSKEAVSLATMQDGFDTENFDNVTKSFDILQKIDEDKTAAIQKTHDDIVAAATSLRDYNYKVTQDAITNTLNSDKFTYQQKQDTIDNILKQSQLDETKRSNLVDEAQKQETTTPALPS